MRAIWDFFKSDRFAQHRRLALLEIGAGRAKAGTTITDAYRNGVDLAHGGAIFTLADLVFAAAANSRGPAAGVINASICFVNGARRGTRYAAVVQISPHPQPAMYSIKATDEATETIVLFGGIVYPKRDQIDPPTP
jgi:acyl-CoA thioesterase